MSAATSRRQLFGASAAMLLLSGAAAGAAKAEELDQELFAACGDYHRAHEAMDGPYVSDEASDASCAATSAALDRVVGLSPRTPEGLQAKAAVAHRALMADVIVYLNLPWREQASREERIALDVLRDLLGGQHT